MNDSQATLPPEAKRRGQTHPARRVRTQSVDASQQIGNRLVRVDVDAASRFSVVRADVDAASRFGVERADVDAASRFGVERAAITM